MSEPKPGLNGFHNTPDGPKPCNAVEGNCPYGGSPHYPTYHEAYSAYEKELEEEHDGTAPGGLRKPDAVVGSAYSTATADVRYSSDVTEDERAGIESEIATLLSGGKSDDPTDDYADYGYDEWDDDGMGGGRTLRAALEDGSVTVDWHIDDRAAQLIWSQEGYIEARRAAENDETGTFGAALLERVNDVAERAPAYDGVLERGYPLERWDAEEGYEPGDIIPVSGSMGKGPSSWTPDHGVADEHAATIVDDGMEDPVPVVLRVHGVDHAARIASMHIRESEYLVPPDAVFRVTEVQPYGDGGMLIDVEQQRQ